MRVRTPGQCVAHPVNRALFRIALLIYAGVLVGSTQAAPSHRVSVRTVNGVRQFYFQDTGAVFVPRGNDFIRLAQQTNLPAYGGGSVVTHSLFNVGLYDASDAENALGHMASAGYNMVRVFLNDCCSGGIGNTAGPGLSPAYLANVADFLNRAEAHGIFVQIVGFAVPDAGGYDALITPSPNFAFPNIFFMTAGGIQAVSKFWTDFITGLAALNAPFDAILGFDIWVELAFDLGVPPLSMSSGTITTANGVTYDLSDASSRQALMDDNLVNFVDQVRSSILAVDPTALVSVSFGPPNGPNPTPFEDPVHQIFQTYPAICCSTLDFIDLHSYIWGLTLPQLVQNFQSAGLTAKPLVMFEYGTSVRGAFFPAVSGEAAAAMLQQWQVMSCSVGFSGWGLWNWDLIDDLIDTVDTNFWTATADHGVINSALSPSNRPAPCQPGPYPDQDLAFGAATSASNSLAGNGPALAVDGSAITSWSAGASAPQWIEVQLPTPSSIATIRLTIAQDPSGPTVHDLYIQSEGGQMQLVNEFTGTTQDGQVLSWTPRQRLAGVTSLRIVTVSSPSWVAWREIEILSSRPERPPIGIGKSKRP